MLTTFLCLAIAAHDGDTLTCADGRRVRLAAIDSPEIGHCRRGRVCTPGDPYAARSSLMRVALGRTLRCRKTGTSYGRTVAFCRVGDIDLSCHQLRAGAAVRRYKDRERVCTGE